MSGSLRSRILIGTTGVTALSLLLASLSVWLTAKTMLYRQLDHVLTEHKSFFIDDHRQARPFGPPGAGPGAAPSSGVGAGAGPGPGPGAGPYHEPGAPPGPPPGEVHGPQPAAGDAPPPPPRPVYHGRLPAEMASGTGTVWVEITDPQSGKTIARSPSLGADEHLSSGIPYSDSDTIVDTVLAGKEVRLLVYENDQYLRLPPFFQFAAGYQDYRPGDANDPHAGRHRIAIACDASQVHKDLLHIRIVLVSVSIGAMALAVMATLWLQRALLKPIERISHGIEALSPENLAGRVAIGGVPDEMTVVVTRLNELLARVEVAFLHEKQTIANIAHELRTPVAGIKTTLEVAQDGTEVEELREGITRALGVADAMQSTISNLLMLARLESGVVNLERSPVDLGVLIHRAWEEVASRADSRGLTIRWRVPESPLSVWASPQMLKQILGNLVDNVVAYATPQTAVEIAIERRPGQLALTIANAADATPIDYQRVFDAFYRGSDARTAGTHCGLGLALVRRMVGLHAGEVSARRDEAQRFAVTVVLATPPESGSTAPGQARD